MSSKQHPTHSAYIVIRQDGSEKKAQWFEVGTVWSHNDGGGFDVVIPAGVTVTGRIVCRKRKEQPAK